MANETEIQPALTPEQWAEAGRGETKLWLNASGLEALRRYRPHVLHEVAAIALHQQPFGFTAEDVALLAHLISDEASYEIDEKEDKLYIETNVGYAGYERLRSLRARIAALLPPHD